MGGVLRRRVLRALGLEHLWPQFEALCARLRRLEQDVVQLQRAAAGSDARPMTIPASPPPPASLDHQPPASFFAVAKRVYGDPEKP
jgi:hypothetical protein